MAAVQLLELVTQQVDLAGPGAIVAAEGVEPVGQVAALSPGGVPRFEVDAGEAVERLALATSRLKLLVAVLPTDLHELRPQFGERRRRDHLPVRVAA